MTAYQYIYVKIYGMKSIYQKQAIVKILFRSVWISIHLHKVWWNLRKKEKQNFLNI